MASKMMPIIGETVGETGGETHARQLSRARTGGETDVPPPYGGGSAVSLSRLPRCPRMRQDR